MFNTFVRHGWTVKIKRGTGRNGTDASYAILYPPRHGRVMMCELDTGDIYFI